MDKFSKDTTIKEFPSISRKAASEGIVLLKNEDNVLPLQDTDKVSLFGRCHIDYYKSGTGSGGAVNVLYSVNALEGLRNKNVNINEDLVSLYKQFIQDHPFDNGGGGWAMEPWFQKEMELSKEIVKSAKDVSNKAIIFIGRTAGEDKDNQATEGGYYLTQDELSMIEEVTSVFEDVAIVLNVGNIIDMSFSVKYNDKIKSILYAWHGGMEGGNALADVLCGDVTPSGKLAGTIAKEISDYPSDSNFGDDRVNLYEEDIYVGYRYFETFKKDSVLYPFGYGLSYTTFESTVISSKVSDNEVVITVEIINTGSVKGKEVIQVYVSAPQGQLGKPALELKAFKKTRELLPNDSEILEIVIPKHRLASYDDGGYTGYKSAYVLEKGIYKLFIGNSVRNIEEATSFEVTKTIVISQLREAMAPIKALKRMKPGKQKENGEYEITYHDVPQRMIDLDKRIQDSLPQEILYTGDKGIQLIDVFNKTYTLDQFIAQLTVDELIILIRGEGMSHPLVTPGTAAAFGGLYEELRKYGIPSACAADGPSGLRMDTGHKATQMPIGSLLACTWNEALMEELYTYEGKELHKNKVDTLLGPGLNIHRHPLCGRNFEYFSEDPYVTGIFSKAAIIGMKKGGSEGTLKHFIANDQEKQRNHIDAVASERALREIHLKGFEIAVKEGNAKSIMTAYNPINGIQAASNYDMNTTILREEWGFDGMVMTDWWAIMNDNVTGGESKRQYVSYMVRSQNDLYMVVTNYGAKNNALNDNLEESIKNKTLTIGELQRSAMNICRFIMNSPSIHRDIEQLEILEIKPTKYDGESTPISTPVKHNTKHNSNVWLEVQEDSVFSIAVEMRSELDVLAQSACNVSMNSEFVHNVQLNGNGNKWTRQHITNVKLAKGFYKFDLEFIKPGLEIGTIEFIRI